jgi:hypothetical protein
VQGPGGSTAGGGWPPPCPPANTRPYMSQPCVPVKR